MLGAGALAATLLALPNASAPPPVASVDAVFDSLQKVRHFRDVALAPDGKRIAWTEKARDGQGREELGTVWIAELPGGRARRLTAAARAGGREHDPVFSPDGRRVAFLSDAGRPRQLQVWVAPAAGGAARALTRVKGQLSDLRWSHDGTRIAFLFVENSEQEPGALVAYKPDAGVVQELVEEQRIAVVELAFGRMRQASPADLYVYDYDWSPDGASFAAEAARGSGTNNYWIAQLYVIDAASAETRSVWKPPLQIACPRFSPDGGSIAVIHGIMSDEGQTGGDVWTVPLGGGAPKNWTSGMRASARALFWRSPKELLFPVIADGQDGVASLDLETGKIRSLSSDAASLHPFAAAREGAMTAAVRESFRDPPEIVAGEVGEWKPVTRANAGARRWWGEAKSLHWRSEGMTVQGWLLYPKDFEPSRSYPMIVVVHGGPSSGVRPAWPSRWNGILPSQGYFVFQPNPRGSYGFGEAFTEGNVKDFGHGDLRDILSGVDAALKAAPIDPNRLGIAGWSYGGYMTMWAVTQTKRFGAAVAGAGIASWQSYYGQNRIDTWMLPFFGASVYEDELVYRKSSPIEYIRNAKTPTLVLHGDRDSEVPTPQGYEFWHALKTLGVPTDLVIYPDEGHAILRPEHQRDIVKRTVEWFDKYLK